MKSTITAWREFPECPYEDLREPAHVHLDSQGKIHLCQSITLGNMEKTPLSTLIREYRAEQHPIAAPLVTGNPAVPAEAYWIGPQQGYVEACHLCFDLRLRLLDRFLR